jgi:hypothetical protein
MDFVVSYSKNNVACMWEKGGEKNGRLYAQIIAGKDGQSKRPLLLNQNFYTATEEHALLPISTNNYIVMAERDKGSLDNIEVKVFQVKNVDKCKANTSCVYHYKDGQWNKEPSMILYDAIDSALKKTQDTKTNAPYYVML